MAVLAEAADDDGMNCFPGTRRIARKSRLSERQVIRTIQGLEAQGWLWVIQRGAGTGHLTEFKLNIDRLHETAEVTRAKEREERCHGVTLRNRKKWVQNPKGKVTSAQGKGDIGAGKGDIGDMPLFVLPGRDPVKDPTPPAPLTREGARETELDRAVDQVMSALAIANRRKRKLLWGVIALEATKGDPLPTIALRIIEAWRRQAAVSHLLRVKLGLEKFYRHGVLEGRGPVALG